MKINNKMRSIHLIGCFWAIVALGLSVPGTVLYALYQPKEGGFTNSATVLYDPRGQGGSRVYLKRGGESEPDFARDEVIIKFKAGPVGNWVREGILPRTVLELNRKYGAGEMEPVFKVVVDGLKKERIGFKGYVEKIKKKYPSRSVRAPKGTKIPDLSCWYRLKLAEGKNVLAAVEEYKRDSSVECAQPNYLYRICGIVPNDPYYSSSGSWGQSYDDLWGLKKIECEDAWAEFAHPNDIGADVVVAAVDTGVDYNHEDLRENIWQNLGEDVDDDGHTLEYIGDQWVLDPGDLNGIDDDGNGKVDDLIGWDFVGADVYNPLPDNDPSDGYGHGSHCAGTIAAVTDNAIGVSGISWHSRIMAVKGLDDDGWGNIADLADGIRYAADNGSDVISNSWGPSGRRPSDPVAEEAVCYAYGLGAVIVFAAGNSDDDVDYYSPNKMDEVLTVAATNQDDKKCFFSNWGEKIDVSAPGGGYESEPDDGIYNILSTLPDNSAIAQEAAYLKVADGYYRLAGTSMACPHVSGLAALLISAHPDLTNTGIMWHIKSTSDNIDNLNPGYEGKLGAGRINAYSAITSPLPATDIVIESFEVDDSSENGDGLPDPGEKIDLKVFLRNHGQLARNVSADLATSDPYLAVEAGYVSFTEINYGEMVGVEFRFVVDESFPSDHDYVFQLTLIYEGGQETEEIVIPHWKGMYVNRENTSGPWEGTREHPYQSIQNAISYAQPITKIFVARGTYSNLVINLVINKSICLCGGYDPADWSRDIQANVTVLDGGGTSRLVTVMSVEDVTPVLSGFTIRNGRAYDGGGIYCCSGASLILTDNVITSNIARRHGGGVYCDEWSSVNLIRNTISNNLAEDGDGGGIHASWYSDLNVIGNNITKNTAIFTWGGLYGAGAGIFLLSASATFNNNVIADNSADGPSGKGGGIACWLSSITMDNNTIAYNSARSGGGIYCFQSSFLDVLDGILWGNAAQRGPEAYVGGAGGIFDFSSTLTIDYSDVCGGQNSIYVSNPEEGDTINWGDNMIDDDPLFTNPSACDFHLIYGSPCIDTGIDTDLEDDIEGNLRPLDGDFSRTAEYDMGAYEFIPVHPMIESGDYNGDGISDIAIFRPSSSFWAIRNVTRCYFGTSGDRPVSGDYDGDGTSDIAIFRNSGLWVVQGVTRRYFGMDGDLPVPCDYDGDGCCDISIFREGLWVIRQISRLYFGKEGDIPILGDFDGDGTKDISIFRGTKALWVIRGKGRLYFGKKDDIPVPADYDLNGRTEIAIFRPSTCLWAGTLSSHGAQRIYFGTKGDIPVPANYDGDEWTEPAIFRPSTALWAIRNLTRCYFGTFGDIPVTR